MVTRRGRKSRNRSSMMTSDRDILIRALEPALRAREEWRRNKSLLGQNPPGESILSPLTDAIDQCGAYEAVAGHLKHYEPPRAGARRRP